MKVERIQLPPSSTYGTPNAHEAGQRVKGSGDSPQQRRNGRQARDESEQEGDTNSAGHAPEAKTATEVAAPSGDRAHALNITA
jgi:hypothetical protein